MKLKENFLKSVLCAFIIMVRHSTARQKFYSYKTEESLQVEPQSNSKFDGSARRGTTYKTGLRELNRVVHENLVTMETRLKIEHRNCYCFIAI